MTFGETLPVLGQAIRIKWGGGSAVFAVEWIDFGTLRSIGEVSQLPDGSWLLSSDIYQNSVVRYYDEWEVKA